ncbi:MAG: restriction endonuclease subunit S [Pseudolabrys sp.]|nr:restriction endonuclease subunit S [Pseudolabrys sp.]
MTAPETWSLARLSDAGELLNGRAYKQSELLLDKGTYRVIRVGNFFSSQKWYYSDLELEDGKYCNSGDLLYAWSASFGPKIWTGEKAIFHYHIWRVRLEESVADKMFLYRWFQWDKDNIKAEHGTGSTMIHVTKGDMEDRPIALPPLAEQRRIVVKLDALTARTARARADLDRIPALAVRYKQAVLAKAFSGELTGSNGVGWNESPISEIAEVGTGSTPKRSQAAYYKGGSIPWVTSSVVNRARVDSADEFITEQALRETNCKVFRPGTLLVAMYGEGQTRGRVSVLGIPAATNQALAAISIVSDDVVRRDYVYWFLRSQYLALRRAAAGGVQPNLNLGIIKATRIPVPPLEEQVEIVRLVDRAFVEIDRMTAEAAAAGLLLGRLDHAVLTKAFRGELVPQDPNDEPASVLIDRIHAERASAPKATRGRRKAVAA